MTQPLPEALAEVRAALLDPARLVRAVAAGRRRGQPGPRWRRAELRPVDLASGPRLQVTAYDATQAFTGNHDWADPGPQGAAQAVDALLAEPFGNWHVDTVDRTLQVRVTKRGEAQVHRAARVDLPAPTRAHDRDKPRLIDPGEPYLHALGITDADGRVRPRRQDKYRQVEEFVRLLDAALQDALESGRVDRPTADRPLRVVDLGCGNAYLTFAAVAHLAARGLPAQVIGVDVKEQARRRNAALAEDLGLAGTVSFVTAPIATAEFAFPTPRPGSADDDADVVLALHACDTATDDAVARGVRCGARLLLVAPCCHHDLQRQLRAGTAPAPYEVLTRHGILRERFGDVLTDALRAHLLRLLGHRVDVVEFVGTEHTPRNVMIRAHRTGAAADDRAWADYRVLVGEWGVTPRLAVLLADELEAADAST
ncbi:MAG: SAM-dependent methyltransferase [Candidatus Nanopelagicales bacterium]